MDIILLKSLRIPIFISEITITNALLSLLILLFLLPLYFLYLLYVSPYFHPLRRGIYRNSPIPGPQSFSTLHGVFPQTGNADVQIQWVEKYGKTMVGRGLFGDTVIFTSDPLAIQHVLNPPPPPLPSQSSSSSTLNASSRSKAKYQLEISGSGYGYRKMANARRYINWVTGMGLFSAEGEVHTRQRRVVNPSFSPAALRDLLPAFTHGAIELRDTWLARHKDWVKTLTSSLTPPPPSPSSPSQSSQSQSSPSSSQTPPPPKSYFPIFSTPSTDPNHELSRRGLLLSSDRDNNSNDDDVRKETRRKILKELEERGWLIDIWDWMFRAAGDVIALVGFDHQMNSLHPEKGSDVLKAFEIIYPLSAEGPSTILFIEQYLADVFPKFFNLLPSWLHSKDWNTMAYGRSIVENKCRQLIRKRQEEAASYLLDDDDGAEGISTTDGSKRSGATTTNRSNGQKDILTQLVRASSDLPGFGTMKEKLRLEEKEVVSQIVTMMLVGQETTAGATCWVLWMLAKRPDIQEILREEILGVRSRKGDVGGDGIGVGAGMDGVLEEKELEGMVWLDAVVRETLRFIPPAPTVARVTTKDDIIPLSRPITLQDQSSSSSPSRTIDALPVKKDQTIFCFNAAFNLDEETWGKDAKEFKPERWLGKREDGVLEKAARVGDRPEADWPGMKGKIWANLMTFGAGPRNCIGYRFALLEMKTVLSILIPAFQFSEQHDPKSNPKGSKIEKVSALVTRPYVWGEKGWEVALPLRIKPIDQGGSNGMRED